MKPKRPERPAQRTPHEVLDALLGLVRRKFYEGDDQAFFKDQWHLLQWALLWPAREWFKPKEVALPPARYQEILSVLIIEAAAHASDRIKYRPAWLKMVIQSHFALHGDEYYEEAKAIRTATENTLLALGKLPTTAPSVVDQFTAASQLLDARKPRRKRVAPGSKQLDLLA